MEIAKTLYIAPGTVRVHVHAILQKLEVRDAPKLSFLRCRWAWFYRSETVLNEMRMA